MIGTAPARGLRAAGAVFVCLVAIVLPGGIDTSTNYAADTDASMSASAYEHLFVLRDAVWWLDSTDGATLFSDSSCTTPTGTAGGSVVKCWTDKQTPSNAVTTTGSGAAVGPSLIGTETPLRFVTASILEGPDLFGGSLADANLFVVLRENTRSQNFLLNLGGTGTSSRVSVHAPWSDGRWYVDLGNTGTDRAKSTASLTAVGDSALMVAWKDSAVGSNGFRVNSSVDFLSTGTTAAVTTAGLTLGDGSLLTSHDIAEVIVFDTRLSAADEAAVEQYLSDKWGF